MSTNNNVRVTAGVVVPQTTLSYFHWEIKPFCISCSDGCIESPEFSTTFSEVSRWKLRLYPRRCTEDGKDYMGLFIYYFGSGALKANVTLSLLNDKNNKAVTRRLEQHTYNSRSGWGIEKFLTKQYVMDQKNCVLVDDRLKIQCNINCSTQEYCFEKDMERMSLRLSIIYAGTSLLIGRLNEFDNYEKLLENGNFSDLTIIVGDMQYQAHKAIISNCSTVFEAMFKHDMREKEESTIEITDIKPEVMKEVLRFMYAGRVNNIEQLDNDLLIAAEKYAITGLKKLCEQTIIKNIEIGNAIQLLKLADMCNAADLKSQVIEFIASNQKAIADKPEFGLFTDLHSEIQLELVRAIITKNSTS